MKVLLKWDTVLVGNPAQQMGIVRVTNIGRRPIYISVAALKLPKGFKYTHLILKESIPGTKLSEGDAPATFSVKYDGLAQYAKHWRRARGYVEDSAGRKYISKKLPKRSIMGERGRAMNSGITPVRECDNCRVTSVYVSWRKVAE